MKKYRTILIVALLFTLFETSAQADIAQIGDPGKSWTYPDDFKLGLHIQEFIETSPVEKNTFLIPTGSEVPASENPLCDGLSDSKCAGKPVNYTTLLPYCTQSLVINCIEDFGVIDSSGKKMSAKFERYLPSKLQNPYKGNNNLNIPDGYPGSIYSIPDAPHVGGDKYYLSVYMAGGAPNPNSRFATYDFGIRAYPVVLEKIPGGCASYWAKYCAESGISLIPAGSQGNPTDKDRYSWQAAGFAGSHFCVASSMAEGLCAQRYAFPAGYKFFAKVKVLQLPGGWMHGRFSDPNVSITQSNSETELYVEGNPIAIPIIYKMYEYSEMPEAVKSQYDQYSGFYKNDPILKNNPNAQTGGRSYWNADPLKRNVILAPDAWGTSGMDQLKIWLPFVDDKATALMSSWSLRTLSGGEMDGASSCFRDSSKVTGLVMTNSTQYSAGPPTFNKSDGSLSYQVGAPHFTTDGKVFKGTYDLVMKSEVARCLYGFSKAPIRAEISVSSANGSNQIATTVMGEKNGWVYLSAKNFEYSTPTVKVTLQQDAVPTPAATKAASVKKSITCTKGKTKKVVTGSNPKCPTGYKKVA